MDKLLLCSLLLFAPVFNEGENTEEPPSPEATSEPDTTAEDAASIIIDYLEQQKEEQEKAAEEQAATEAAAAEQNNLMMIEQAEINAYYTNQQNVVQGYANKYRYYLMFEEVVQDGYYTRTNRYVYVWDAYTKFELEGDTLKFDKTGLLVSCPYQQNVTSQLIEGQTNIGGLTNAFSNIDILDMPSYPSINKTASEASETLINVAVCILTLFMGYKWTVKLIDC